MPGKDLEADLLVPFLKPGRGEGDGGGKGEEWSYGFSLGQTG